VTEKQVLDDISNKLDIIINILRLVYYETLLKTKELADTDLVTREIVSHAKGKTYGEVVSAVAQATNVSEMTVKRRIAELRFQGLIVGQRIGKEVIVTISPALEGL